MRVAHTTHEVAAADVLSGERGFATVATALLDDGRALWVVRGPGDAVRGLSDLAVRDALQSRLAADTTLWQLADAGLVSESVEAAVVALGARGVTARVVERGDGFAIVERITAPARDAVVMAGGFGTRLRPLTDDVPKPLLQVGDRPLLCRILAQLRAVGIERVHLSVHYLAERVRELIGDGSAFGVEVRYLTEELPLGTGAGLSLLDRVDGPFLLMNGDVLTDLDLAAMVRHHASTGALATVATFIHANPLAYGVVHCDGGRIDRIEEKPVYRYPVNAGIYAFAPQVLQRIERGRPLAMVDFLNDLAPEGSVARFPLVEYWNDVGSHADYERAQTEIASLRDW